MKQLLTLSIQKRWLMLALFLLLGFFGYYSWTKLSVEAYPDIADVTSQVVTQVPGLAVEEVEQQITIPWKDLSTDFPECTREKGEAKVLWTSLSQFVLKTGRLPGRQPNPGTIIRSQSSLRSTTGTSIR